MPILEPNAADFPDASMVDCRDLLEAPAGRHGFAFVGRDGRLYFEDGTRARFWGVNVAKDAVFQPPEVIDQAADAIARAGFNLVRLHHLDDEGGLLPSSLAGTPERVDAGRLAAVDYWIAALKRRGVYVYLDLLDYRTFREAEGVPSGSQLGRGAKPYALFNDRLMELQRDFAGRFLFDHVNPHTGLSYAADPALCMVELCDENGLFHEWERLPDLKSPYREELVRRWNLWLLSRYGSREILQRTWTDDRGRCGLRPTEDPGRSTVALPGVSVDADTSLPRLASRAMFFADLHREYFRSMTHYLRSRGLRCPVTAVTAPQALSDLWASAQELDCIATNYYYDHPYYRRGQEWQLPAFFSGSNVLTDARQRSFAPTATAARVVGKPLILREWGACWPNDSRGPAMLQAAAYACLQDVDMMLLFALDTRPDLRKMEFFDVRHDPVRWGLVPACARMFLRQQVAVARRSVAIAHSTTDVFLPGADSPPTELHDLSRVVRLGQLLSGRVAGDEADLVIAAGRGAATRFEGGPAIISSDTPASDPYGHAGASASEINGYLRPGPVVEEARVKFGGTMFSAGEERDLGYVTPLPLAQVASRPTWRAIGTIGDTGCLGLRDMERKRYVFGRLGDELKLRVTLDALRQCLGLRVGHEMVDRRAWTSDTGEIIEEQATGILLLNTPGCVAVAGSLEPGREVRCGALTLVPNARVVACIWQSLDDRPLSETDRWSLRYVTVAGNSGQQVRPHLIKPGQSIYAIDAAGGPPVITFGRPSDAPLSVALQGRPVLRAHMSNGSFELLRSGGQYRLACDTPGVRLELPALPAHTPVTLLQASAPAIPDEINGPFTWREGLAVLQTR